MSEEALVGLLHPARSGTDVTIWMVDGVPARLACGGASYRVSDTPTRLEDENPELAYRLGLTGWRFQGTGEDGTSYMFDIRRDGDRWRLIRVYD